MLRNTPNRYGLVTVTLHWLMAVTVFGLFALGLWMSELDYYDAWYQRAPALHKGIGILLFLTLLLRIVWRAFNIKPQPEPGHAAWERRLAAIAHVLLYALLFAVMLAGYFISTADGRPIEVFGLFDVPATLSGGENQEDIAGEIHEFLAFTLIGLVALHAGAALKHHFIDHDNTLRRMFGRSAN